MRAPLLPEEPLQLHSLENEICTLGAMLFGQRAVDQVLTIVESSDFFYRHHQLIFQAIQRLTMDNKPVDLVTLETELAATGILEEIGGRAYLVRIAEAVPTPANARFYAENVREYSTLRALESAGTDIVRSVRDTEISLEEKISRAEASVFEVGAQRIGKEFLDMPALAREVMLDVDHVVETGEPTLGLPSGFVDLDEITTGFYGGDLIIVAARPSMGKTALVMAMAQHVAQTVRDKAVAVFSLEMSAKQLTRRLVSMISRVNSNDMKRPYLTQDQLRKITIACEKLYGMNLFLDESADISGFEMLAKCRRLKKQHGLSLVVVDYLQLMRGNRRTENRVTEVSEIARALKAMAKDLDVPVIALSQLSRGVENRDSKIPQLSDLRESGSIEAEADMVMMIYRKRYYERRENPDEETVYDPTLPEPADIIIAKNRNGATDTVKLAFTPAYALFSNLSPDR